MHVWQIQEAKAKLTKLLKEAKKKPQIISRRGVEETVIISIEKYKELIGEQKSIVSFFKKSPLYGVDLTIERDRSFMRDLDL